MRQQLQLAEGEATQPLRSAKEIAELRTHRLRILDSLRQSSIHVSGRSQDQLVVEDDSALAVGIGQSQPQSEAPLCAFGIGCTWSHEGMTHI